METKQSSKAKSAVMQPKYRMRVARDKTVYRRKQKHKSRIPDSNYIVTDDIWVYGVELTMPEAEKVLCRTIQSGPCDAYITRLTCGCGSTDVVPIQDTDGQYTHFSCEWCGSTVDDHLYDKGSFKAMQ